MLFEYLEIDNIGLKVHVNTKSKSDNLMLKKILHSLVAAHYQQLDSFESYDLPIGNFSLEYSLNTDSIEIEMLKSI